MENNTKRRNYGMDIFKIFSMFMVVAVHVMDGIVPGCQSGTTNEYVAKFIQTFFFFAVNCFALSSGYIQWNIKYKFNRIVRLWMPVFFYSVSITILFLIFSPGLCSKGTILLNFFPLLSSRYWYFTSYVILFLFIPYINKLIQSITKEQHMKLSIILFIVFSIIPMLAFDTSTFNTNLGFSFYWLFVVYIWGSYLGRYGLNIRIRKGIIIFILCYVITFFSRFQFGIENIPILSYIADRLAFYRYDSPTMVIGSMALLAIFARMDVNNEKVIKIVNLITPLTFNIYIIHSNPLIKVNILHRHLPVIAELFTIPMLFVSMGIIVAIFVVCLFIDWIRFKLFKLIKADRLVEIISSFIEKKMNALVSKLADN